MTSFDVTSMLGCSHSISIVIQFVAICCHPMDESKIEENIFHEKSYIRHTMSHNDESFFNFMLHL